MKYIHSDPASVGLAIVNVSSYYSVLQESRTLKKCCTIFHCVGES